MQMPPDWRTGMARDESPTQPPGHTPEQPAGAPPLALDGFCPVTLAEKSSWTSGDARHGAIHRGRLYLFVGPEEQKRFLANPDYFSPVLSGFDAVRFAERGELVAGNRAHGLFYKNQVFLFTDEQALERFCKSPESFAETAYEAMRRSGEDRQLR
jgi:protein disulfide-isomerase